MSPKRNLAPLNISDYHENMKRLDIKATLIFYTRGWLIALVFALLIIPLSFAFAVPAAIYSLTTSNQGTLVFLAQNFVKFYVALVIVIPFIWSFLTYYSFRYSVKRRKIEIKKGILLKQRILIPLSRVQSIKIMQGPMMQFLNLADVHIHTTYSSRSHKREGHIPGVTLAEAQRIRDYYLRTSSKNEQNGSTKAFHPQ